MSAYKLATFTNLHFNQEVGAGFTVSKSYLYTLVLIAIIVMVIACFNFINLNVAVHLLAHGRWVYAKLSAPVKSKFLCSCGLKACCFA